MPQPQTSPHKVSGRRMAAPLTESRRAGDFDSSSKDAWSFFIDRGGTFTDIVAVSSKGSIKIEKLLSSDPELYKDAAIEGIRRVLGLGKGQSIPQDLIQVVKMGTTIGTNALLERKGERVVLVVNRGFKDALRIGYQNRPEIFALNIQLPQMLYEEVIEVGGRNTPEGEVLEPLDLAAARRLLTRSFDSGIKSCAIVLMHADRYHAFEKELAQLALAIGFEQVSVSHEVSPLVKLVARGDTTVADAYLTPLIVRYLSDLARELPRSRLYFMQSNGGLTPADRFRGRDCLLSGPAGGVVAAAKTSELSGFAKIIGFDMGGTSTDVSHYAGSYERTTESVVAGVRIRAPMIAIHTVAAGGGSILTFDGDRCRVGPESAGASPGPACYLKGGPLTVTDANLMVGRIQPRFFPKIFGPTHDQPLGDELVRHKFALLTERINSESGSNRSPEEIAEGFLEIAVDTMANAVRKISTERGYDLCDYALASFGGAGGQHACSIAESLGMRTIVIHPLAGVLSAFGIGVADTSEIRQRSVELELTEASFGKIVRLADELAAEAEEALAQEGVPRSEISSINRLTVRYQGTDASLVVELSSREQLLKRFEALHQKRYGFIHKDKSLFVEAVLAEALVKSAIPDLRFSEEIPPGLSDSFEADAKASLFMRGKWHEVGVFDRRKFKPGRELTGPAIVAEATATTVIEPGWKATVDKQYSLVLTRAASESSAIAQTGGSVERRADPVRLELFNNQLMASAEEMGLVLQNTSHSVNIKERLDFSCAIFDSSGRLIANAPHIPVHLGSMSESVHSLIRETKDDIADGDVYLINNPYLGGTHLPDITAISPVFIPSRKGPVFFVASRGHHADIGGITPGSMPPSSRDIREEGVIFSHFPLVKNNSFNQDDLLDSLTNCPHPARNPAQNIADLRAQIAANNTGKQALLTLCQRYGIEYVEQYMNFVRENAASAVRRAIDRLKSGSFETRMDDGAVIRVTLAVDRAQRKARIDFTGTSAQRENNMNAPLAITKAAILYVFRSIVMDNIPLNDGCLEPIEYDVPPGSLLNPEFPAAVVAGNVETSQALVDTLYGAMGLLAASQGTMNNFTFGDDKFQYYETICGGAGAGPQFDGTDAVHTHMTNSRLTDPEVLEMRFPVLVRSFAIRRGSGGGGRHSGGCGAVREIEFRSPMLASILSQRRVESPFGLDGGRAGARGRNYVRRKNGTIEKLSGTATVEMKPGDAFVIETPGGGGFGEG